MTTALRSKRVTVLPVDGSNVQMCEAAAPASERSKAHAVDFALLCKHWFCNDYESAYSFLYVISKVKDKRQPVCRVLEWAHCITLFSNWHDFTLLS
jgi:kynureninase